MSTLIVIPHPETLPAEPSLRARRQARRSAREVHGERAEALHGLAAKAIRGHPAARAGAERAYTVLEGVGVLLVDEEHVDRHALEADHRARVYDNVRVAGVSPSDTQPAVAAAPADYWHLSATGVAALHAAGVTGSGGLVGVLDTGIAAGHPEFAGKQIAFAQFDQTGKIVDGARAKDFGLHGTHVAGLVAGRTAGTAPDADLAVAAVLTVNGENGYLAQILGGLDWLVKTDFRGADEEPGVHLVNASLEVRPYNAFLLAALDAAARAPGTLGVAASGNSGSKGVDHVASPASYSLTLAVGSTDPADRVASFSDWGTIPEQGAIAKPDLVAPGVGIHSAVPPNLYQEMSGTSMSCGIVCGIGALLIEQTPALAHDPHALLQALTQKVLPLPAQGARAGSGVLRL